MMAEIQRWRSGEQRLQGSFGRHPIEESSECAIFCNMLRCTRSFASLFENFSD